MSRSKTRLYFGKLREDVRERDLQKFVRGYGQVRDISIKKGYGFVVSGVRVELVEQTKDVFFIGFTLVVLLLNSPISFPKVIRI